MSSGYSCRPPRLFSALLLERVPQLNDDDGTALVDGIQQLALIAQDARAIAAELQQVRKDGVKSGYVKVEAVRAKQRTNALPTDEPPF